MKRTAILLDGGFVRPKLQNLLGRPPRARDVLAFADSCLDKASEELFRIYYYDCPPFGEVRTHPLTSVQTDFAKTPGYQAMTRFLREISQSDHVAYRPGILSFDGWAITDQATKDIISTGRALQAGDVRADLKQKRVDIKIGLDVAWMASKRIVDRLILVTGDSDFVPAMKFARLEGVQIALVSMGHNIKADLRVHSDEIRAVVFPRSAVSLGAAVPAAATSLPPGQGPAAAPTT